MKVAIFSSSEIGDIVVVEDKINDWIAAEGLCAADIMKVCQSESIDTETNRINLTISVWYIPRPVEPQPQRFSDEISMLTEDEAPF